MLRGRVLALSNLCIVSTGLFYLGARARFGSSPSTVELAEVERKLKNVNEARIKRNEAMSILIHVRLPYLENCLQLRSITSGAAKEEYKQLMSATKNSHFRVFESIVISYLTNSEPDANDWESITRRCVLQHHHDDAAKMWRIFQQRGLTPTKETWRLMCTSWLSRGKDGLDEAKIVLNNLEATKSRSLIECNWKAVAEMLYTKQQFDIIVNYSDFIIREAIGTQNSNLFRHLVQALAREKRLKGRTLETQIARVVYEGRQNNLSLSESSFNIIQAQGELSSEFIESLRSGQDHLTVSNDEQKTISDSEASEILIINQTTLLSEQVKCVAVKVEPPKRETQYRYLLDLAFRSNNPCFPSVFSEFYKHGKPGRDDLGLALLYAYSNSEETQASFLSELSSYEELIRTCFPSNLILQRKPSELSSQYKILLVSDLLPLVESRRDVLMRRVGEEITIPGNRARAMYDLVCTSLASPDKLSLLKSTLDFARNPKQQTSLNARIPLAPGNQFYNRCAKTFAETPALLNALAPGFNIKAYDEAVLYQVRSRLLGGVIPEGKVIVSKSAKPQRLVKPEELTSNTNPVKRRARAYKEFNHYWEML